MSEQARIANPFGAPVYWLGTVLSTMDEARALAVAGCPSGTVVAAEEQTAGRGRIAGRVWKSAPGESLLCTTVLRFPSLASMPRALTLRVGLAAAEAIEAAGGFESGSIKVKWPNDVLVELPWRGLREPSAAPGSVPQESSRSVPPRCLKLCGILCESDGSAVFAGTGFNIGQGAFPPELERKASSIFLQTGRCPARETLLEAFLRRLDAVLRDGSDAWRDALVARLFRRGCRVRFESGAADSGSIMEGTLVGIGASGEILISEDGKTAPAAFVSGELKVYDEC